MTGFDVSPAELAATRQFLGQVFTELVDHVAELHGRAEHLLGSGWTGAAAGDFAAGWREWHAGAGEVLTGLSAMGTQIGVAATTFAHGDVAVSDEFAKFSR